MTEPSKAYVCGRWPAERLRVRISSRSWRSVTCECCVLSGRSLCDKLSTRPEESHRLWCVVLCDLDTTRMRRLRPALGYSATGIYIYIYMTTCVDLSKAIFSFPSQHNGMTYVRKYSPTQITFTILLSAVMFPFFQRILPLRLFPLLLCRSNFCAPTEVPELVGSNHISVCAGIQWNVMRQKLLFHRLLVTD